MATEHNRVELKFPPDDRLVLGASAAAEHFAQRCGLELGPRAALVAAVEEACKTTFGLLNSPDAEIQVSLEDFADRIEIGLTYPGEPLPSVGLESFAGFGAAPAGQKQPLGLMLLTLVDRVQYQTAAGLQRITLIKYLPSPAANSA